MGVHYIFSLILMIVKLQIIHFKITLQIVMEEHYIFTLILLLVKY
jgi:hypothetical protein